VLQTLCRAAALKNNNCLAFMLTSYLKSVAAGPQQPQLNVKTQNGGKAEGKQELNSSVTSCDKARRGGKIH
jgi:hypothetical protein